MAGSADTIGVVEAEHQKTASKTLKQCQTKRNFHQLSLGNSKIKHNIQKMSTSFFSSLRSL